MVTTTQSTSTPGLEETRTLRKDTALLVNGTRRWSTRDKHQPPRKSQPNSFSQIAPVWFYSLLGSFLERRDNKRVWGGTSGAKFLANLFQTLAIIVECSRNTPGTDALAKDLVQLVWGFRNAEISEVRASVLFAVATSFGLLRTDAALSMILEDTSTDSLGYNLPIMAREDPDENCRNIAGLLVRNVASAMNSSSPGSSIM